MPSFSFRRAFPWVQRTLRPIVPIVGPDVVADTLLPTFDVFGSQRMEEVQFEGILGPLGAFEATHSRVPAGFIRHYLCMQYSHDEPATVHELIPVLIVTTPAATFPAVALKTRELVNQNSICAIRNVVVPPLGFIGARVDGTLGPGARLTLRVLWVEMPVGEYLSVAGHAGS